MRVALEGVQRWPNDWRLRTALLNGHRDARRPDAALEQARAAMQITPDDFSPLHDAAWALAETERFPEAAALFEELLHHDPGYPEGRASLHYARYRATGAEADKQALLLGRDRGDRRAGELADEIDPPVPFVNVLPDPGDATLAAGAAHRLRARPDHPLLRRRRAGRGALPLAPHGRAQRGARVLPRDASARRERRDRVRGRGGAGARSARRQGPGQHAGLALRWAAASPPPTRSPDGRAQGAIAWIARHPFGRQTWDAAARTVAEDFGPDAYHGLMSVLAHPPMPAEEDPFDAFTWTWRSQVATALVLSHFGPWESGSARAALFSMLYGPSDWTTGAAIVALGVRAATHPPMRAEIEQAFGWLRTQIPERGYTSWEIVLAEVWLSLGHHPPHLREDLERWIARHHDTVHLKNTVQAPERRYAGLTLEQYAQASAQGQVVPEWQEALNASPALHRRFLDLKSAIEMQAMGVSGQEKAALDQIKGGQMDMHLRMAQQQQAQRAASQPDQDPDPEVFPGQAVARLSDYVSILKGMQTGDMNGALARYGLTMMTYGSVAQAWGAKMAADPVLTEKFNRMMQS